MFINQIKKGFRVQLNNGLEGTMFDSTCRNLRTVEIEDFPVFVHLVHIRNIVKVIDPATYSWVSVELSPRQKKSAVAGSFFKKEI